MGGLDQGPAMPGLFGGRERMPPRRIGLFAGSPATRADLLRRLGRSAEAAVSYREALDLASTDAEYRYLARRLAEATGQ